MLGISAITSTKLFSLPSFLLALFFTGAGSAALVRLFFVSLFHGRCTSSTSSESLVTSIIVFLLVDVDGSGSVNSDCLLCVNFTTPGILTTGLEPNTSSKTSKCGLFWFHCLFLNCLFLHPCTFVLGFVFCPCTV